MGVSQCTALNPIHNKVSSRLGQVRSDRGYIAACRTAQGQQIAMGYKWRRRVHGKARGAEVASDNGGR